MIYYKYLENTTRCECDRVGGCVRAADSSPRLVCCVLCVELRFRGNESCRGKTQVGLERSQHIQNESSARPTTLEQRRALQPRLMCGRPAATRNHALWETCTCKRTQRSANIGAVQRDKVSQPGGGAVTVDIHVCSGVRAAFSEVRSHTLATHTSPRERLNPISRRESGRTPLACPRMLADN